MRNVNPRVSPLLALLHMSCLAVPDQVLSILAVKNLKVDVSSGILDLQA